MNITYALRIEYLSFKFDKKESYFFDQLSLALESNKLHFIQGKNGSGKSTLFRILRGITYKDEVMQGNFYLGDKEYRVTDKNWLEKEFTSQIKMVQQKFDLMMADQFTFIENLKLANLPEYPSLNALPIHKPIPELIKRFSIDYEKQVHLLSGGQRQILAILMALQKPTTILLLDEPTAALDEKNATMVMEFLTELLKSVNITIVVICHDRDLVNEYAHDYFFELEVDEEKHTRSIIKIPLQKK